MKRLDAERWNHTGKFSDLNFMAELIRSSSLTCEIKSILIVDDNEDEIFLLQRALSNAHFTGECLHFNGVSEAMAHLHAHRAALPQLILCDLKLPGDSGLNLLKQVKSETDLRRVPFILLTSSWAPTDLEAAYALGANSYLVKPVTMGEFTQMVQSLLNFWKYCVFSRMQVGQTTP